MKIPHHIVKVHSQQRFPKGSVAENCVNHWEIILAAFWGFAAMRPLKSARRGGKKGTNVVIFFILMLFPNWGFMLAYCEDEMSQKINKQLWVTFFWFPEIPRLCAFPLLS